MRSTKPGQSKVKLPRANVDDIMGGDEDAEIKGDSTGPSGPPIGLPVPGGSSSGYPPHEMRYLTYKHARWSLRVRKEVGTMFAETIYNVFLSYKRTK